MTERLSQSEERFAQAYVETDDLLAAYSRGYPRQRHMDERTRARQAAAVLRRPRVQAYLAALSELHLERHKVTVDQLLGEYQRLAFFDIRKIFTTSGELRPVHEMDADTAAAISSIDLDGSGGRTVKIRVANKLQALDALGRHLGMFVERSEISGPGGRPIQVRAVDLAAVSTHDLHTLLAIASTLTPGGAARPAGTASGDEPA